MQRQERRPTSAVTALALGVVFMFVLTGCSSQQSQTQLSSPNTNIATGGASGPNTAAASIKITDLSVVSAGDQTSQSAQDVEITFNLKNDYDHLIDVSPEDFELEGRGITLPPDSLKNSMSRVTIQPGAAHKFDEFFMYNPNTMNISSIEDLHYSNPLNGTYDSPILGLSSTNGTGVTTTTGSSGSGSGGLGMTLSNFQQIDSSYSVAEVNQVFGFKGVLQSESGQGTSYDLKSYSWQDSVSNAIVTITFANGYETAKDQVGLN